MLNRHLLNSIVSPNLGPVGLMPERGWNDFLQSMRRNGDVEAAGRFVAQQALKAVEADDQPAAYMDRIAKQHLEHAEANFANAAQPPLDNAERQAFGRGFQEANAMVEAVNRVIGDLE